MRYVGATRRETIGICAVAALLACQVPAHSAGVSQVDTWPVAQCFRALDRTVLHINEVDNDTAEQGLTTLANSCASVPQIQHNLAVLAAKRGDWEKFQTSADQNPLISAKAPNNNSARSVVSVDFELYSWWHALAPDVDSAHWLSHYVKGYPPPPTAPTRAVSWDAVERDIQFTAQDAAVVLSWTRKGVREHRFLLLNLIGERWQIYHESGS